METKGQEGEISWMKTLTSCTNKVKEDGFKEDFLVTKKGLTTYGEDPKLYRPDQVSIVNFYRFEGTSDPGDNSILYVIETDDGVKGTLVDGYGAYSDEEVSKFISEVQSIEKKIFTSNVNV
jgi:hypothetical protein